MLKGCDLGHGPETVLAAPDGRCAAFANTLAPVARKLRSQSDVVERCRAMQGEVKAALARLPSSEPEVVDAVWHGEALGTLLWALQLEELPPYDEPFETTEVVGARLDSAELRDREAIDLERESARLWHWRARTAAVQADDTIELPERFASYDQLIAATAMRGFEQGLLPAPMRGDFHAYGKVYRHLSPEQQAEAHAIAAERQHALSWLCGEGERWDDVPLDT
jgi:hypothetical protein